MTFDLATTPGARLACEPFAWVTQELGDQVLVVYADSRRHQDGTLTYDLMIDGAPIALMPVVTGPEALLDESYTEWATDHPGNAFDWKHAEGVELDAVPDHWEVDLHDGHTLTVHANDHEQRDGEHLFTLAVRGGGLGLPVLLVSDQLVRAVRRIGEREPSRDSGSPT